MLPFSSDSLAFGTELTKIRNHIVISFSHSIHLNDEHDTVFVPIAFDRFICFALWQQRNDDDNRVRKKAHKLATTDAWQKTLLISHSVSICI